MTYKDRKLRSLPMPKVKSIGMFSTRSIPVSLWSKDQIDAYANRDKSDPNELLITDSNTATSDTLNGDELLKAIDASIKGYSIDVRDELRSEIALAVLTKASQRGTHVTTASLNLIPANVRRIAKAVYKTLPDRYRNVSLEHCYGDGRRLADCLAG